MPPAPRPLRHRGFLAGAALVALFAAASLLAPVLAPEDPHAVAGGGGATLEGPSVSHPLGTDALGRDVLSRVLWGGRASLAVGVGVETLVVVLGCAIGLLAGYFGGPVDAALMRVTDVVMAFPSLVLAIGLIAVFERPGLDKVFIVLVALGWTTIARVVRGEGLSLKARGCVRDTAACCPSAASSSGKRRGAGVWHRGCPGAEERDEEQLVRGRLGLAQAIRGDGQPQLGVGRLGGTAPASRAQGELAGLAP